MRKFLPTAPILWSCAAALSGGCVTTPPAEDPVQIQLAQLDQRLGRVERILDNESLLELANQIQQLQEGTRQLRGDIEELSFQVEGATKRQRDLYLDVDQRLQHLERSVGRPASVVAPVPVPQPGPKTTPPSPEPEVATVGGSDRDSYQQAVSLLREGQYDEAARAFQIFLRDYPRSDLAGNAQYWFAETYYVRRNFPDALAQFEKVVQVYPQSFKVPDALLKVGYCNYELAQWAPAREALDRVVTDFPDSTAARLASQRLARMDSEGH